MPIYCKDVILKNSSNIGYSILIEKGLFNQNKSHGVLGFWGFGVYRVGKMKENR